MDLSFLNSITYASHLKARFRLSYDIACRWGVRFWDRLLLFQPKYRNSMMYITFYLGVPKFHLPGHGRKCHSIWSLNFRDGWARTDGEGIERFWALINRFATASREMASGSRHDFLDYQIGSSNFRKLVGMGGYL
jgi:hypothetical protein